MKMPISFAVSEIPDALAHKVDWEEMEYDSATVNDWLTKPVTTATNIIIEFEYPLNCPCTLSFDNANGFTAADFLKAVFDGYTRIYAEEEAAVGETGNIPGLLNRATSEGPHGIWGHDMCDLFLEGFDERAHGIFDLVMGS